jgi:hypothetical protein
MYHAPQHELRTTTGRAPPVAILQTCLLYTRTIGIIAAIHSQRWLVSATAINIYNLLGESSILLRLLVLCVLLIGAFLERAYKTVGNI